MENIETATKFSRLKNVSCIEDNYLEAVTGAVLQKKLFLKISQCSEEEAVLEFLFNFIDFIFNFIFFNFIEKRIQHRCFPVRIANFDLF